MLLQQGDVLLKKIDKLPNGEKKQIYDKRGIVFAEGEATGHYHLVKNIDVSRIYTIDGKRYFENDIPVEIEHQEHDKILIPAGIWEVGIIVEYDHFTEEAREVID